jgi:hypothetical protein
MKRICCLAFLLAAPLWGSTTLHSKFVGTYVAPAMEVSLGSDGSATVTEEPGNSTTTLFGHWIESGSVVRVTFDAVDGQPAEPAMEFKPAHDGLQAVTWNHAVWGKDTPPPLKAKARAKERITHSNSAE